LVAACSVKAAAELKQQFDRVVWGRRPDFTHWLHEVARSRQSGVALDDGDFQPDLAIFSAPIFSKQPAAKRFVSLGIHKSCLDEDARLNLPIAVKSLARELSSVARRHVIQ